MQPPTCLLVQGTVEGMVRRDVEFWELWELLSVLGLLWTETSLCPQNQKSGALRASFSARSYTSDFSPSHHYSVYDSIELSLFNLKHRNIIHLHIPATSWMTFSNSSWYFHFGGLMWWRKHRSSSSVFFKAPKFSRPLSKSHNAWRMDVFSTGGEIFAYLTCDGVSANGWVQNDSGQRKCSPKPLCTTVWEIRGYPPVACSFIWWWGLQQALKLPPKDS